MEAVEREIEKFFWAADVDRSGTVTLDELQLALVNHGRDMSEKTMKVGITR